MAAVLHTDRLHLRPLAPRDAAGLLWFDREPVPGLPLARRAQSAQAIADAWSVLPNGGTAIVPALRQAVDALARWPAERFHLQISVDGLGQNHDRIRGRGAFDALAATLAWLKAQKTAFTLSMCVTSENVDDMPGLVDFAAETGAGNLHFIWFFILGRGTPKRFVLS